MASQYRGRMSAPRVHLRRGIRPQPPALPQNRQNISRREGIRGLNGCAGAIGRGHGEIVAQYGGVILSASDEDARRTSASPRDFCAENLNAYFMHSVPLEIL